MLAELFLALLAAPTCGHRIVGSHPHDPQAFTQGLVLDGGVLYESTGLYGHSSLRAVELETGRVLRQRRLPGDRFGEGLALCGDRLYQLTWRAGQGFIYDKATLDRIGTFRYEGEGWGLACDGRHLILSDGTPVLRFLDPEGFRVVRRLEVRDGDRPIERLNELEFIRGRLYANIWLDRRIAVIDLDTGQVEAWLDFPELPHTAEKAMNGIAYDPRTKHLWVTGKLWPEVFEVELDGQGCEGL
ncbi:MAG: glutaminyl-peptide cyclotransferase [Gammaproteobacteria bacterium]|nr:MAG: glutaminyl-peptide cyclotransferase [Gammaproteobacteria bacterium]